MLVLTSVSSLKTIGSLMYSNVQDARVTKEYHLNEVYPSLHPVLTGPTVASTMVKLQYSPTASSDP